MPQLDRLVADVENGAAMSDSPLVGSSLRCTGGERNAPPIKIWGEALMSGNALCAPTSSLPAPKRPGLYCAIVPGPPPWAIVRAGRKSSVIHRT